MVRIPNRGSARYLARKYNRNETYIRYAGVWEEGTFNRLGAQWRLGVGCMC